MEDAFQEWACKHPADRRKPCKQPADFECDACGLLYSTPPPSATFQLSVYREPCVLCDACGLFVHDRCQTIVLSPSLCLFAKTRIRERKSRTTFAQLILPELKLQHAHLLQRSKLTEIELKQLGTALEEASYSLSWALKTFANAFYPTTGPAGEEKLAQPTFMPKLLSLFGSNPAKFRQLFSKLAQAYPDRAEELAGELARVEDELLRKHEDLLARFEDKETQLEKLDSDRDELFREIHFPVGSVLNSPYRMRFSVPDYIVVAIADFFLEKIQCKIHLQAGCSNGTTSYVLVEITGFDSPIASIAASLDRFALYGTSLPISTYSATSMSFSFEFSLRIKCEFTPGAGGGKQQPKWHVNKDETKIEILNFKHHLQGASFPLPARVLDLVVDTVFASQVKAAVLELLPVELGDFLRRASASSSTSPGLPVIDMELRVQSQTAVTKAMLHQHISAMPSGQLLLPGMEPSHLNQVCIALSPRQSQQEEWTLAKLLSLYTRFYTASPKEWAGVWRLYGFPQYDALFAMLQRVDHKPQRVQLACSHVTMGAQVKQVVRCVKDVLLRVYASDAPGGGGGAGGAATRALVSDASESADRLVHSVLFHAVKQLSLELGFGNSGEECELVVSNFRMTSVLSTELTRALSPDRQASLLVGMINDPPSLLSAQWTTRGSLHADTGALEVTLQRTAAASSGQDRLSVSLHEWAARLVCDTAPAVVGFRLGFKADKGGGRGGVEMECTGQPKVETDFLRMRLAGPFASYFQLARDVRGGGGGAATPHQKTAVDEVDAFLARMQKRVTPSTTTTTTTTKKEEEEETDNNAKPMRFELQMGFEAQAVEEDQDVFVRLSLRDCLYDDEIELITLVNDVQAVMGGGSRRI